MKRQKSCGPRLGKLVHQLLGVVTFAYDLCFRRTIAHWKGLTEKNNFRLAQVSAFGSSLGPQIPKKRRLGPQNGPRSLEPEKLPRWKTVFRASGIGGWPPISTWINPPSLGSSGLHCVDFPHQMRKFLLNFAPGEPLALVQELPWFEDSIKLDPLLSSALDLRVHNLITGCLLHAVRVKLCWCQLLCYL
jgi:hypothetical protein